MIVKFFTDKKHKGRASPRRMMNYLLRAEQSDKEGIKVLRGNPEHSCKIAEQLSFSKNYTAGCLSFLESDLTEENKIAIMDSFEKMAFANMDREQYNITWIEHRDKGRLELNFFSPEVDLRSGKRFQLYYHKRDVKLFNAWRDYLNLKLELADPTDPSRRQNTTYKPKNLSQKAVDIKTECEQRAAAWYADGSVQNRAELADRLIKEMGFKGVAKDKRGKEKFGKDYFTLIRDKDGKDERIRLKGALFERVAPKSSYSNAPVSPHKHDEEKILSIYRAKMSERRERHTASFGGTLDDLPTPTPKIKRKRKVKTDEHEQRTIYSIDTKCRERSEQIARASTAIAETSTELAKRQANYDAIESKYHARQREIDGQDTEQGQDYQATATSQAEFGAGIQSGIRAAAHTVDSIARAIRDIATASRAAPQRPQRQIASKETVRADEPTVHRSNPSMVR